jgi:hypothetical protein
MATVKKKKEIVSARCIITICKAYAMDGASWPVTVVLVVW